jgi:hypothetical protein
VRTNFNDSLCCAGVSLQSAALVEAYVCDGTAPEDAAQMSLKTVRYGTAGGAWRASARLWADALKESLDIVLFRIRP